MALFNIRNFLRLRDFYDVMNFVFFLQYFAFSVPTCAIRDGKTLAISKSRNFLEIGFTVFIFFFHLIFVSFVPKLKATLNVIYILFWTMTTTSLIASVVPCYEYRAKINEMKLIFEKIRHLDGIITINKRQMRILKIRLGIWSIAILLTLLMTLTSTIFNPINIILRFLLVVNTLRVFAFPAVNLVQFFTLVSLVQFYLEWVDAQLLTIQIQNENDKSHCAPFTTFRPHFGQTEDCKTACKIERIRKIFGIVHDLKQKINETFSLRLWADVVNTICLILFFVYMCLIILQKNDGQFNLDMTIGFHYFMFWSGFLTVKILQNVSICGRVTECGKTVGVTVHKMMSRSYCESVRQELMSFSLELLHRDPSIKAYKFFSIDYPLIPGMFRGIIMQLVALLQINIPEGTESNELIKFMGASKNGESPPQHPEMMNATFPPNILME